MKLEIKNEADRLTVAAILIKNGYTVRIGSKKNGKQIRKFFVEAFKEEEIKWNQDL